LIQEEESQQPKKAIHEWTLQGFYGVEKILPVKNGKRV
jgi:hypothetical protein